MALPPGLILGYKHPHNERLPARHIDYRQTANTLVKNNPSRYCGTANSDVPAALAFAGTQRFILFSPFRLPE
jgi:hypothetical protein